MPDEEEQEGLLLGGQVKPVPCSKGAVSGQVDPHVGVSDRRAARPFPSPGQGADPGEQFLEIERLAKVVVGAAVQPSHAVGHGISGREEEHRSLTLALAEPPQQAQAVRSGKPPVQQDEIPLARAEGVPPVLGVAGVLDRVPLFPEPADDEIGDLVIVFDYQDADAHVESPPGSFIWTTRRSPTTGDPSPFCVPQYSRACNRRA